MDRRQERWNRIVERLEIPPGMFSLHADCLRCKLCNTSLKTLRSFEIRRHMTESDRHLEQVEKHRNPPAPAEDSWQVCTSRQNAFNKELSSALIAANIPFESLNTIQFRDFLSEWTQQIIPYPSTLRKSYADICYQETIEKIRGEFENDCKIWLSVDETTDSEGRYIAHAIVAPMYSDRFGIQRLINCAELEATNGDTIVEFIEESSRILWPAGIRRNRLQLFVSDAAPYMKRAGTLLSNIYYEMIHVTCLCHGLHRIAEEVRNTYENADRVIADGKKALLEAPSRVRIFREVAPDIRLPPDVCPTRWGKWLESACYYSENFIDVQRAFNALIPDAASVRRIQRLITKPGLQEQFRVIKDNFKIVADSIKCLEERQLSMHEAIVIVERMKLQIFGADEVEESITQKVINVFAKNTGYQELKEIDRRLQDNDFGELPQGWNREAIEVFRYASMVSVETERSFSRYKNVLSDNRRSIKLANLSKIVIVHCNTF